VVSGYRTIATGGELEIELGHADAGRVESELRSRDVAVLDTSYAASVVLRVGVEPDDEPRLHQLVAELTAGEAHALVTGERWVDLRR
jgi:putative IMPACT (imprinted ancient) family translation regulator